MEGHVLFVDAQTFRVLGKDAAEELECLLVLALGHCQEPGREEDSGFYNVFGWGRGKRRIWDRWRRCFHVGKETE